LVPTFENLTPCHVAVGQALSCPVSTYAAPNASLSAGSLPPGVTFVDNGDGTGTLTGTPTTNGTFAIPLLAQNDVSSADAQLTLTVTTAPSLNGPSSLSGTAGSAVSTTFSASGYPTPSFNAPGLPSWLSLHDNGDGTATLSGTPSSSTSQSFSVTASNLGGSSTQSVSLSISGSTNSGGSSSTNSGGQATTPTTTTTTTLPLGVSQVSPPSSAANATVAAEPNPISKAVVLTPIRCVHLSGCSGTLTLSRKVTVTVISKGRHVKKLKTIQLGKGTFAMPSGAAVDNVVTYLTKAGRQLLKSAAKHHVNITEQITLGVGVGQQATVVLR
jgi:hypothetical protein